MNMAAFRTAMAIIGTFLLITLFSQLIIVLLLVFGAILLAVLLRKLGLAGRKAYKVVS